MQYISTRNKNAAVSAAEAIAAGLSKDGGLYTPKILPHLSREFFMDLLPLRYEQRAAKIMALFLDDFSSQELEEFSREAYTGRFDGPDPAPLHLVNKRLYVLELWHGPTCAFKDMALQMLPHLLTASLKKTGQTKKACILVATSGDTGKAALEGFRDIDGTKIFVFYPRDGVSKIQKLQMDTQKGNNVGVCAVKGNFDDAQTGVKAIFSDEALRDKMDELGYFFSSANSINWGRVLPQIVYYISAYCDLIESGAITAGQPFNVCVPTGNFGNILAAFYAKKMGAPIQKLICASNKNNVLTDLFNTGLYDRNRAFYNTSSPSMDILISSNFERLLFDLSSSDDEYVKSCMQELRDSGRYRIDDKILNLMQQHFWAAWCDDDEAAETIAKVFKEKQYLIDPHTAVAYSVFERYRTKTGDDTPSIIVSTASPYKFCDSVLDALGCDVPPDATTELIERLEEKTGTVAPVPLKQLRGLPLRFDQTVETQSMPDAVLQMLEG